MPATMWALWSTPSIKIGIAMTTLTFGEAMNRGIVWYSRHLENEYGQMEWTSTFVLWATVAAVITTWGALCTLRVSTPPRFGEKVWLIVLAVAIGFACGSTWHLIG